MTDLDDRVLETAGRELYDRTPPQDLAAEQSVLGGMLLSKDAIADVVEEVRGQDFYRPAHELVYDAIIDLYGRGEPADAITVSAELSKRGELGRIGGAAYLHTLISSVPTAANAGYYARLVRDQAILRRLVEAGTRIAQLGYATDGGEVDELVNEAQAEVYAVTERRSSEDYLPLRDTINLTMEEIENNANRGEGMVGVPTGFSDLDLLTNGLHPGQMIIIAARPAIGKALALDTELPTPTGWTTMGEVAVGDLLIAADGTPTRVVAATDVMEGRPCYEVTFDDGTVIIADAEHQWLTTFQETAAIRTTAQIAGELPGSHAVTTGGRTWTVSAVRSVKSVPVRCVEIDHPSHLYLASRSRIPTHNSTLSLDICRSASIKHGMTSVIFSLEMGRTELTMRLLSAEAGVPLQYMRKGTMRDEDWTKVAGAMSRVSEAPLFIDDSPNMSLMEIRAKGRRLKQRHDLRLIVVDYLQLMSSGKRVESRQQEVSEFSRALKLLAKELEVPVIAVAQLNRGPEQRTDKKPMMSDLRESGCLTADTRVMRADTGAEITMGELFESGETDVPVWALDDRLKYVERHITNVFSTGVKPVYRLKLASGREVKATANHPFLTYEGWVQLGDLDVGSRIGVPRHLPAPSDETGWDDRKVVMLARILGDAPIPPPVFSLPKRQIALFLRHVWERGDIGLDGGKGRIRLVTSRVQAEAVTNLLMRFGVDASLSCGPADPRCVLEVQDREEQRVFLERIGGVGATMRGAREVLEQIRRLKGEDCRDGPLVVWTDVQRVLVETATRPAGQIAPAGMPRVAQLLDNHELDVLAVNDLRWDRVLAITPLGEERVYDATVAGNHNFIANGIAVHNSLEQDADMVVLLHREDAYDKDSRPGEADIIVAKHRNGPTDTITVAFQGHYSRFHDMAQ